MSWLYFALLAPVIYTAVNFIDKYLVAKVIRDYNAMPIYIAIIGLIFGCFIWLLTGRQTLMLMDTILVLLVGYLIFWAMIIYFRVLSFEETSKIIILFQMIPVFVLIFSDFFLREHLSFRQTIGFLIVFASSVAIVVENKQDFFNFSKSSFFYMIIYDIIWASANVLMKFVLVKNAYWSLLSYESWGVALGGLTVLFLSKTVRRSFLKTLKQLKIYTLAVITVNESTFITAKSVSYYAFYLGPVSLVSLLNNTQIFYGIFFGWLLTLIFPKIFQENIQKSKLIKKTVIAGIMFLGIILL